MGLNHALSSPVTQFHDLSLRKATHKVHHSHKMTRVLWLQICLSKLTHKGPKYESMNSSGGGLLPQREQLRYPWKALHLELPKESCPHGWQAHVEKQNKRSNLKSSGCITRTSPFQCTMDARMETMLYGHRGRSKSNIAKQVCMQCSNPIWEIKKSFST